MTGTFACSHGHHWDAQGAGESGGTLICPICGASGASSPALDDATWRESAFDVLPPPPQGQPMPPSGPGISARLDDELPDLPGYEVISELGRGGMGVVYQARQLSLNRIVALKMILPGGRLGAEELVRLRTEAQAVARLQHPHIVQIHEVGEHRRRPYLCLEFVSGGNLARLISNQPLQPVEAARLVEILARTMHFAHTEGIVHRDLKPANVLLSFAPGHSSLTNQGRMANDKGQMTLPKITDFGLAKQLDVDSGQTRSGVAMGTPSYMAPEQARGQAKSVGPAVDIYALGAILYEALTGRPPFVGASPMETLHQLLHEEPVSPRRLQPRLARDLETICLKCLQKDPGKRYASAEALAKDLQLFLAGEPIRARAIGPVERVTRWCRRNPKVAGLLSALVLVLAAGFVAVTVQWRRAEAMRDQAEDSHRRTRRVLTDALASMGPEVEKSRVGELPLREELLQQLITHLGEYAALRPHDDDAHADLALAHFCLGKIKAMTSRTQEAAAPYQEAIRIEEALVQKQPTSVRYRRELAQSRAGLGHALRALGPGQPERWPWILDLLEKSLLMREQLSAEDPQNAALRREVADSYQRLAFAYHANNQSRRGLPLAEKAIELWRQLCREHPDNADYRTDLAAMLNDLGLINVGCEDFERALAAFDGSLELKASSSDARGQFRHRHLISVQHFNRGKVLLDLGRIQEAADAARQAGQTVSDDLSNLHRVGRVLALCSQALTKDEKSSEARLQAQTFADEALQALRAAEELGLLAADLQHGDFAVLRSRADFQRLTERVKLRAK